MNNIPNADELSAQIRTLLDEGRCDEALDMCARCISETEDGEMKLTARLLMSYSRMAAGDAEGAVAEHRGAVEDAGELLSIDRLGIAEEALGAHLPFEYCAQLFYTAAQQFEEEDVSLDLAAGAYNKAGICLFRQGSSSAEEQDCFRRALDAVGRAEPDDDSKQEVLEALIKSNLAECLMREGESSEAALLYNEAADVFSGRLDEDGDMCLIHYAICQRCLSDIHRAADENIQAHACLTRSITQLERRVDELSDQLRMHLAVCCNARGTLRFQMGNYEGEIDDCTRSLQLREGLEDDPNSLATVLSNRAEAHAMLEHYAAAKDDFFKAVELFDSVPENGQMAASAATRCYSVGLICAEQELNEEACDHFRDAAGRIASLRASGMETGEYSPEQLTELESFCRMRLGMTLSNLEEHNYFDALTENREAIRLLEKLPATVERYARLASLHIANGELLEMFDELGAAEKEYHLADVCRGQGVELILSGAEPDYGEEDPEEAFQNESSIWENFSGSTPQA